MLIADDHAIVRRGLRDILSEAAVPAVLGEAKDGHEAIAKGLAEPWDVIVLDITMPGPHGLEVLKAIKHVRPEQHVLMLTMHATSQYIRGAFAAGADGYLTKESAPGELLRAISAVMAGEQYLGDNLSALL